MKEIIIKNTAHLGDCILTLNLLNKVIKVNDIKFVFSVSRNYVNEVLFHVEDHNRIFISSDLNVNCLDAWVAKSPNISKYFMGVYDPFYFNFYNEICNHFNLISPILSPEDVFYSNIGLNIKNSLCYDHDFFILNSMPYSGQFPKFSFDDFKKIAINLSERGYKVITINDVNNYKIPNTISYKMNLVEIGSISKYSKNIIGVATSTAIPCVNYINYKRIDLNSFYLLTKDNLNIPFVTVEDNIDNVMKNIDK